MANYSAIKAAVNAYIKANGKKEITGHILNSVLNATIDSLGRYFQFAGGAMPTDDPGTPDQNVCYLAGEPGVYTNFGGITIENEEVALLFWNGEWVKESIALGIQEVAASVDNQVGTPSVDVSYSGGQLVLTFHNIKGEQGIQGEQGAAAGFGTIEADINEGVGTPGVSVETSGDNTAKNLMFHFTNLKGETGVTSVVATIDDTSGTPSCQVSLVNGVLTLAFSGLKGLKGDTGVSADYPVTIYNGLDSDATDQALAAAQGKVLDGKINQLSQEVDGLEDAVMTESSVENTYQFSDIGGRYQSNGVYVSDVGSHRGVVIIPVTDGASYKITTYLRSAAIPGVIYTSAATVTAGQNITPILGTEYPGTGSDQTVTNQPLTIPAGTTYIIAQTSNLLNLPANSGVFETVSVLVPNVYTKAEADSKFTPATAFANKVYGVKWDTTDPDDLGDRCFDAVGMTAQIGIGTTDGHSDFDNVLPWSGMKRCNITTNANGAKIVTFEGEAGFALDGSNGDVFVRIPKFYSERYIKNGFEYIEVSAQGSTPHPAFIEDGKELNEIFVGAFEGKIVSNKLRSVAGEIPTNNETGTTFLAAAKENGDNYTLYDLRAVDALWRLMAVEYGCRNSNQILGWGYADFQQPIDNAAYRVTVAATNTNTVVLGLPIDEMERKKSLSRFSPGNTLTICDGSQYNIVAQRVITSVSQASTSDYLTISFDGAGVDVTVGMFAGSAPCVTNRCETIDAAVRLSWHTGRTDYTPVSAGINNAAINPCRYRWIENIVGSAWHFLPDVTFNGLQMYVCPNMKDYEMFKYTSPYMPVGPILTKNTDNGNKADVVNANYWVTKLMNDIFAPAVNFGVSYDKSLTSTKAFGAYYYLYDTRVCIVNGGGFDHLWRCNILTNRAWVNSSDKWYLYGARLMFKNIS